MTSTTLQFRTGENTTLDPSAYYPGCNDATASRLRARGVAIVGEYPCMDCEKPIDHESIVIFYKIRPESDSDNESVCSDWGKSDIPDLNALTLVHADCFAEQANTGKLTGNSLVARKMLTAKRPKCLRTDCTDPIEDGYLDVRGSGGKLAIHKNSTCVGAALKLLPAGRSEYPERMGRRVEVSEAPVWSADCHTKQETLAVLATAFAKRSVADFESIRSYIDSGHSLRYNKTTGLFQSLQGDEWVLIEANDGDKTVLSLPEQ
ncbi:hypothetical protein Q5752_000660 [Cryptotrichosporon argae]